MNEQALRAADRSDNGESAGMRRAERRQRRFHPCAAAAARSAASFITVLALAGGLAPLAAGAVPIGAHASRSAGAETASRHAAAMQALLARRYADAYRRFAELADEGHAPSASLALSLLLHGASMFGREWSVTPGQLQRWRALADLYATQRSALISAHERGE